MKNTIKTNLSVDKLVTAGPGDYDNHIAEKWSKQSKFIKSPLFGSAS